MNISWEMYSEVEQEFRNEGYKLDKHNEAVLYRVTAIEEEDCYTFILLERPKYISVDGIEYDREAAQHVIQPMFEYKPDNEWDSKEQDWNRDYWDYQHLFWTECLNEFEVEWDPTIRL